jgi:hypothetical protein
MDRPISEAHGGNPLSFPPTDAPVPSAQSPELPDSLPFGDRLNIADRADDLEVHCANLARSIDDAQRNSLT